MAHGRKQIRDALVAAVTGLATTGSRVFPSRVHPLPKDLEPSLLVYAMRETSAGDTMGRPITLERTVTIAVEAVVKESTTADDTLDQVAAEVEAAVGGDPHLGGIVLDTVLTETDIAFSGEGEMPVGRMRLEFETVYRTKENDAETLI